MKNCRMLKQMQLNTFMDLDTGYQHTAELIAQTYDEPRHAGIQDGENF